VVERATGVWELLVVDNGSTDRTREVAAKWKAHDPARIRIGEELTPGLSRARNLGVRLARGGRIAFLDDDAVPSATWQSAVEAALDEPEVLAVGGPVESEFDAALPPWFRAQYLPYLSAWDRGGARHDLVYNEYPRGTNMAFRREAFDRVGDFDPHLGRSGASLRSCEEIELCLRLTRSGGRVLYEPAAGVRHKVAASRLTPDWLVRRYAAQGFSEAIVEWKHFGWLGLRDGLARSRDAGASRSEGGDELELRCRRATLRAYRRGALYAALLVPRWRAPSSGAARPE